MRARTIEEHREDLLFPEALFVRDLSRWPGAEPAPVGAGDAEVAREELVGLV